MIMKPNPTDQTDSPGRNASSNGKDKSRTTETETETILEGGVGVQSVHQEEEEEDLSRGAAELLVRYSTVESTCLLRAWDWEDFWTELSLEGKREREA